MQAALEGLTQFGIDPKDVKEIDGQPWLSSQQLATIARKTGEFLSIDVEFKEFVPGLGQVVWAASVTDSENHLYRRTGVASLGEKLPTGVEVDEHELAASRALRSALAMAGFDALRPGSRLEDTVTIHAVSKRPYDPKTIQIADEAAVRVKLIRELHAVAEEAGLIVRRPGERADYSVYRTLLEENFDTHTSADFTEQQFTQAIGLIRCLMNSGR